MATYYPIFILLVFVIEVKSVSQSQDIFEPGSDL